MNANIKIDGEKLAEFCRKNHLRKLSLFGSVLRDDFREDGVDVLVESEPDRVVEFRFIEIQEELSELLGGYELELLTPGFLNHRIKDCVLASAQVQYDEG